MLDNPVSLDKELIASILDMPMTDALNALDVVPTGALTPPGAKALRAISRHADSVNIVSSGRFSIPLVHADMASMGELKDADDGTRALLNDLATKQGNAFHFPQLLHALNQRHFRQTFRNALDQRGQLNVEAMSIEEIARYWFEQDTLMRNAYALLGEGHWPPYGTVLTRYPTEGKTA